MTILVLAAHPDDEVLGLGGTVVRHAKQGEEVVPVIFADGSQVRYDDQQADALKNACKASCQELGAEPPVFMGLADQQLDAYPQIELTQTIEGLIDTYKPEIIYTHHHGDMNCDHRVVAEATLVAARPKPNGNVKMVLAYFVPSSTDWAPALVSRAFLPNWFVDVSKTFGHKLRALSHYALETPPFPHPRSIQSIECQARYWGSSVGCGFAEPFVLLRNTVV